jgi:hypothetical protein
MRNLQILAGCLAWLAAGCVGAAEPGSPEAREGQTPSETESKRRVEFMKQELDHYSIAMADHREMPLSITPEAVLRYSNPVRTAFSDGAVFLWLNGDRPLAAAVLSIRNQGRVVREFTSLTKRPLECRRDGVLAWSPRSGNLVDQLLANVPPPDASQARRLRQMRDIARQFRVVKKTDSDVELRLMPQPIYRFADKRDGVIDGAVFAFVEATDPDFLLLVEGHDATAAVPAQWLYTLARMSSTPLEVELDGRQIWSAEGYWDHPRSLSDSYAEMPFGDYPPR